MAKKIFGFIIVALLGACSINKINEKTLNQISKLEWSKETKSLRNEPGAYYDMKLYSDSVIYMTEHFNRYLIKYNKNSDSYVQIGKQGRGPGEYTNPYNIFLANDGVVINDVNSLKIQKFSYHDEYLKEYKFNKYCNATKICIAKDSTVYLLNTGNGFKYFVINNNNENYLEVPICIQTLKQGIVGTGSIIEHNNVLYVLNPYEWKIYSIEKKSKKENSIELKGIEDVFSWDRYYNAKINEKEQDDIFNNKFIHRPEKLFKIVWKDKMYFMVCGGKYSADGYKQTCYVFDTNGNPVTRIVIKNEIICDVNNGVILLAEFDNDAHSLKKLLLMRLTNNFL